MDNNKTYRIKTNIKEDEYVNIPLEQNYDLLEILSLQIKSDSIYKLHTSNYGCLVGRVLANGGVGVPNAKLSAFIKVSAADETDPILKYLYNYRSTNDKNEEGIRYNLLPDSMDDKCYQVVGTFPNKRLVLDDNNVIEIYDKYYKYTTVTNNSGDYMLYGIPTGNNIIHMDIDLSDIGILSQKPRDLYYKGYSKSLFENSSQFKKDTNLNNLTQIISQNESVYVYPFWGDEDVDTEGATQQVRMTRKDFDVNYKFEPTCIFIGSLVADEKSQGFSKKCIPSDRMGKMDRLTTGSGTIEMIRKRPDGDIETFPIQGNDLIDGSGTWCYQIPMNLDYVKTDEYGNLVPAENENVGIPTRTSVRFRISLADYESDSANAHLPKILVPNNPQMDLTMSGNSGNRKADVKLDIDYNFGSATEDVSFRDLFWNNVYTVKQFIPRIQNLRTNSDIAARSKNFSGIKTVNVNGSNNPIPYNNMRINLTFLFIFQCIIFKCVVLIVKILNGLIGWIGGISIDCCSITCHPYENMRYVGLDGSACPSFDGVIMAINAMQSTKDYKRAWMVANTLDWAKQGDETENETIQGKSGKYGGFSDSEMSNPGPYGTDSKSSDTKYIETGANSGTATEPWQLSAEDIQVSADDTYFIKCTELQFAMEHEVIHFDFYNDWINGMLYFPRWFAELKKFKRVDSDNVLACNENYQRTRQYVQQCAVGYTTGLTNSSREFGSGSDYKCYGGKCHKKRGRVRINIFGKSGGIIHTYTNLQKQKLYYLKPCEILHMYDTENGEPKDRYVKTNLFSTDIVLLGNTSDCNIYGIPTAKGYPSSTYIMPPPTGMILSESQEMDTGVEFDERFPGCQFQYNDDVVDYMALINGKYFVRNRKIGKNFDEESEVELSGIDWGYNPFTTGDTDNTAEIKNQIGGHFLEIGCVASMSNVKSCANLQRVCELGSEMAQSHYYVNNKNVVIMDASGTPIVQEGTFIDTTGIISGREIPGLDVRTKFASLNSTMFDTKIDKENGFKQYDFIQYTPNNFDGSLNELYTSKVFPKMFEVNSKSYLSFRFNDVNFVRNMSGEYNNFDRHYLLINNYGQHLAPVFENSFYFYFGIHDGNTAIDRLYTEYFSDCTNGEVDDTQETIVITQDNATLYDVQEMQKIETEQALKEKERITGGWNKSSRYPDLLSFAAISDCKICLRKSVTTPYRAIPNPNIEYIKNNDIEWQPFTTGETRHEIELKSGDVIYLRGNNSEGINNSAVTKDYFNYFEISGGFAIGTGNIMSILNYEYKEDTDTYIINNDMKLPTKCFYKLFNDCGNLLSVPELKATNLGEYCYSYMFWNCSKIIKAPSLPATTLAEGCYSHMFDRCSSLVSAPALPATTLAKGCYEYMFWECKQLHTAPSLHATTLADNCYKCMFEKCYNLIQVPDELPATTLANNCYEGMFFDCEKLMYSPELPATTLVSDCYKNMFYNCYNLRYINVSFTAWRESGSGGGYPYTSEWVCNTPRTSEATFYKPNNLKEEKCDKSAIPCDWTITNKDEHEK